MNADRQWVAQQQSSLFESLVASGPVPEGFNADDIEAVRRSLANKRRREALASWPGLAAALGEQGPVLFSEYAESHARPSGGSPLEDGYLFCEWLRPQRIPVAREIVARYRQSQTGLSARPQWQRQLLRCLEILRARFEDLIARKAAS